MASLVIIKASPTGKIEVDVKELTLRLQSLTRGCNIEVVRLAISSMLDEIKDAVGAMQES
ncbi:hypothetical protein LCGC14_1138020 [marine sediment metagenome]|uniref:Uncharacterized protein n=1 Tax=marine sediment metagenome TaxID=412755 RepID=A0A0F9M3Y0_9ZZZZ